MGIGSVGISAVPIFPITFLISGKLSSNIFDAAVVVSIVFDKPAPVIKRVSTAKSPSSKEGINSAPRRLKSKIAAMKSPTMVDKAIF